MVEELKKVSSDTWDLPAVGCMKTDARVYASDTLMHAMSCDKTLSQVRNVACLPGIVGKSLAMPDAHQGYGFSIGGVAAFDLEKGVISPGGVGYDINCGVRFLATNITREEFLKNRDKIVKRIQDIVPAGKGYGTTEKLTDEELTSYLEGGASHAVSQGFGVKDDLKNCEEGGCMKDTDVSCVSSRALARGRSQLGTLGSGNHFLEFQYVEDLFDESTANEWGLVNGMVGVMIHCGSRGFGHQIASDYIKKMESEFGFEHLPDRELVCAPFSSDLAQEYLKAMNCAINFAFANRQIIMHRVREVLEEFYPDSKNHLVYDVAHNIAKIESHIVDGSKKDVCIHRKGATRSFEGQPVLIPGSMGTSSYILRGSSTAEEISFGSTAHGAGRVMGRKHAVESLDISSIKDSLEKQDILLASKSERGILEEAPEVYKDIDEVVRVSHDLGIATRIARLKPLAVIKG